MLPRKYVVMNMILNLYVNYIVWVNKL